MSTMSSACRRPVEQMEDLQQMPGFASVGVGRDGEAERISAIFYRVDRIQVLDSGTFWLSETPRKGVERLGRRFEPDLYVGQDEGRATRQLFTFSTRISTISVTWRGISRPNCWSPGSARRSGKYPVFCSGDFNSGAGSDPVEVMLSAFSDAEAVSQTPPYTPGWSYTDFGVKVPERLMKKGKIDFLFVNDRVTVLKFGILTDSDGRNHPSDHFPVFVEALLKFTAANGNCKNGKTAGLDYDFGKRRLLRRRAKRSDRYPLGDPQLGFIDDNATPARRS
ncbi:MAG: hypothetical protein ACLUEV_04070 [Alistipes sp.]